MKRPLMLTRYELSCLRMAVAEWEVKDLSSSQKAAATRLYKAISEKQAEMDAAWKPAKVFGW